MNTQATILDRALDMLPEQMTSEAAKYLLTIRLDAADEARANELAEKARAGTMSEADQLEIEEYRRIGRVMEMLRIRASGILNKTQ